MNVNNRSALMIKLEQHVHVTLVQVFCGGWVVVLFYQDKTWKTFSLWASSPNPYGFTRAPVLLAGFFRAAISFCSLLVGEWGFVGSNAPRHRLSSHWSKLKLARWWSCGEGDESCETGSSSHWPAKADTWRADKFAQKLACKQGAWQRQEVSWTSSWLAAIT